MSAETSVSVPLESTYEPHPRHGALVGVLMGVSGAGKTIVGVAIEKRWNQIHPDHSLRYLDGDDFHSDANKTKMGSGQPLTDQDRETWLQILAAKMQTALKEGQKVMIGCSALKHKYRQLLFGHIRKLSEAEHGGEAKAEQPPKPIDAVADCRFLIYLDVDRELLKKRMENRKGHYMKVQMLESQLQTLEKPTKEELEAMGVKFHALNAREGRSIDDEAEEAVRFLEDECKPAQTAK